MNARWIAVLAGALALASAAPGLAQTTPSPTSVKPDVVTPAPAPAQPKPARDTGPIAPPDGVFEARLVNGKVDLTLTLTCAAGFIVQADVVTTGKTAPVVSLRPSVRPDSSLVQLIGRGAPGSVRLEARFFDVDRGEGTFTGTWERRQAGGAFTIERR